MTPVMRLTGVGNQPYTCHRNQTHYPLDYEVLDNAMWQRPPSVTDPFMYVLVLELDGGAVRLPRYAGKTPSQSLQTRWVRNGLIHHQCKTGAFARAELTDAVQAERNVVLTLYAIESGQLITWGEALGVDCAEPSALPAGKGRNIALEEALIGSIRAMGMRPWNGLRSDEAASARAMVGDAALAAASP